jgi:precorrin-2/cobalt-factor-2 C20-methyltransferase
LKGKAGSGFSGKYGTFYGVGVGPGDPELLTVKAINVLKAADVIAVPVSKEGSGGAGRALSIVEKGVGLNGKEILELYLPMTRDMSALKTSRDEAAARVAGRLNEGHDVAFITVGDPMIYSTFSYLIPCVRGLVPGVEVRVVPGVSSISAAASVACRPLAESNEKVIIVPAAYEIDELRGWLKAFDTVILMKVNRKMDELVKVLEEAGVADNTFFAENVGMDGEEVVTDIKGLKGKRADYFSMIIVKRG